VCDEPRTGTAAALLDAQSGERPSGSRAEGVMRGLTGAVYGDGGEFHSPAIDANSGGASRFFYTSKSSRADRNTSGADNTHPTVKPTDLMRWLVRLVTPPGGLVLDPFAGSGSTLVAARAEGFRAIGIEREQEYADICVRRLSQLSLLSEEST
jgi:DNA modification methylase